MRPPHLRNWRERDIFLTGVIAGSVVTTFVCCVVIYIAGKWL
jgi:hypothetical protein